MVSVPIIISSCLNGSAELCPGGNAIVAVTSLVQSHAHFHLYFAHLSRCELKQQWIVFVGVCVFLISSLSPCCFCNGSSRPLHTLSFLVLIEHVVLLNYSNWCQQMKNVCLSPPSTLPPLQPRHLWRAIMLTMVKLDCVCHCLIKSKKKKRGEKTFTWWFPGEMKFQIGDVGRFCAQACSFLLSLSVWLVVQTFQLSSTIGYFCPHADCC